MSTLRYLVYKLAFIWFVVTYVIGQWITMTVLLAFAAILYLGYFHLLAEILVGIIIYGLLARLTNFFGTGNGWNPWRK